MPQIAAPRLRAVLQALFVTFLWSTSWVLIKVGLQELPALTFAGLRYMLAFLCLLPIAARPAHVAALRSLSRWGWARLVALGVLLYAATQGAQFLGLAHLPPVTVSLLLSFTPVVVALVGIPLLAERPSAMQWGGSALALAGALAYFHPVALPEGQRFGYAVVIGGVLANAASSILGRRANRDGDLPPVVVTVVSMGVGALVLVGAGLATEALPPLSPLNWGIILWLAVVNTAAAITLWNRTLRTLSAVESSVINNTMLIQIAVLAWLFLGERLTTQEIAGLALVGAGTLIVQLRREKPQPEPDAARV